MRYRPHSASPLPEPDGEPVSFHSAKTGDGLAHEYTGAEVWSNDVLDAKSTVDKAAKLFLSSAQNDLQLPN
jgi:hypothetical protein